MSGRDLDPHRIHQARHYIGDDKIAQSANALRAIARGEFKRDRAEPTRPEDDPRNRGETPAVVSARLDRERLTPHGLTVACEHAEAGAYCWPNVRGVCGERIAVAARALAATFAA